MLREETYSGVTVDAYRSNCASERECSLAHSVSSIKRSSIFIYFQFSDEDNVTKLRYLCSEEELVFIQWYCKQWMITKPALYASVYHKDGLVIRDEKRTSEVRRMIKESEFTRMVYNCLDGDVYLEDEDVLKYAEKECKINFW